ncbi:purple acid phosphatase 15 isoform X1 [Capsicum chacoense]
MSYSMTTLDDGNITSGGIHFIMLEGYVAYYKSNDQYKWLEKNLAKVDRIVAMEELLYEYGVDLVFNCHVMVETVRRWP